MLPSQLAIAVLPHLIPAVTLPSGAIERALTEPLADDRDEVIYLVCSHPRVKLGNASRDGYFPIYAASGLPRRRHCLECLLVVGLRRAARACDAISDPVGDHRYGA